MRHFVSKYRDQLSRRSKVIAFLREHPALHGKPRRQIFFAVKSAGLVGFHASYAVCNVKAWVGEAYAAPKPEATSPSRPFERRSWQRIAAVSFIREHPLLWRKSDRAIVHALKSAGIVAWGTKSAYRSVHSWLTDAKSGAPIDQSRKALRYIRAVEFLRQHPELWSESEREIVRAVRLAGIVSRHSRYTDCRVTSWLSEARTPRTQPVENE